MRPLPNFTLHRPGTLGEALNLLNSLEEARPVAGGTDLLVLIRDGELRAKHLVDLGRIGELGYIREDYGVIRIGAATTHAQILGSELIAKRAPVLQEAIASMGSVQTRNMGTLGGNLCNASPAADTAPALLILEAELTVTAMKGQRSMPLGELFAGPKMNSLGSGELLTEIRFSNPPPHSGASFHKLGRRRGFTLSIVNSAAYIEMDGDICREARVALGAVAPTPLRMAAAEETLEGEHLSRQLIVKVSSVCRGLVAAIDDVRASAAYRREMSCVLARRALIDAWERARGIQR